MNTEPERMMETGQKAAMDNEPVEELRSRPPESVSYFVPWMIFLMILAIAVAWFVPVRAALSHWFWRPVESGARTSYGFVALAYRGVSDKPGEIPADRFRDHLEALQNAGYKPISLKDVQALYRDGRPLPEKAVLLTFEHGRRSSYFETRGLLRRMGWNAVMCLWVRALEDKDPASLRWPYVRGLVRSGNWEVMLESYDGFQKVPVGPSGHLGNFLTTPIWNDGAKQHEPIAAYQDRLRADHEQAIGLVEHKAGIRPFAFAYPFGDFGQYHSRAVMIPAINMALVERYYQLAFLSGNLAYNSKHSDPRRLNRLLVPSDWTGKDLVAHLDRARPSAPGSPNESPSWIVDWGDVEPGREGGIRLHAAADTTGAKAWLAGSDLARDFHARVVFRLEQGQLGLYFRAGAGDASYVYLGVEAPKGEAGATGTSGNPAASSGFWLRNKEPGGDRYTLESVAVPLRTGQDYTLDVYFRDQLFDARLDGKPLFSRTLPWSRSMQPGMLGVSVWSGEKGRATAEVLDLQLLKQPEMIASWQGSTVYDRAAVDWIHQNAYRLTAIGPRWRRIPTLGPTIRDDVDFTLYRSLAKIHRLKFVPGFVMEDERGLNRAAPSLVAEQAAGLGADGLFLDLSEMGTASITRLAGWIQQCGETLAAKGLTLFLQVPRTMENRVGLQSLIAVVPNGRVVLSEAEASAVPSVKAPVIREDVPMPSPDDLPVFYLVPGLPGTDVAESSRGKTERLYQSGMAAFQDDAYDRAIRFWKEWLELEPENPRTLMLIGDAEARLNNLDSALDYYAKSLDLDPGQVTLALRRARLLDSVGRTEDARALLNLYARLFPEDEAVRMAQVNWLIEKNQYDDALKLIRQVIQQNPENLEAIAIRLRMETDPILRHGLMEDLIRLGSNPSAYDAYAQILFRHDLLTLQDARPLIRHVLQLASSENDPHAVALFQPFVPRIDKVSDTFLTGEISNEWRMEGGTVSGSPGRIRLSVSPRHAEATLKMQGSMHTYNGFVECVLEAHSGSVWLFARRTADHLVRFGISGDQLYLQAWRQGRLVAGQSVPWVQPKGSVRLSLEVSGQGAMGRVNGKPAFTAPIHIPDAIGRGWIGIAAFDPERGVASVDLRALMVGPLPPRVAFLKRPETEEGRDAVIAKLRPMMAGLNALCPEGYGMDVNGNIDTPPDDADPLWRLFTQYHQVWLLPVIRVPAGASLDPVLLKEKAADLKVDGFFLLFDTDLDDATRDGLRKRFADSDVRVVVGVLDPDSQTAKIFGLGGGLDLTGGAEAPVVLPIQIEPTEFANMPGLREGALMRF